MKRVAILALLTLALPLVASASSIDITNVGGTLSGNHTGITLSNSTLIQYGGIVGANLGTLSFSTGALTSGSVKMGGTFAGGGSFMIVGNGSNGVPNGVIFNGTFSGPVTWTLLTLTNGTHNYTLQGAVSGMGANAATIQVTINTGRGFFHGHTTISSGDTNLTTVPEPGTLGLLGTGLVGIAGVVRHRLRQQRT